VAESFKCSEEHWQTSRQPETHVMALNALTRLLIAQHNPKHMTDWHTDPGPWNMNTSLTTRIRFPAGEGIFFFATAFRPDLGPFSHLFSGYEGLFPTGYSGRGVKLTLTAESKKAWNYTSTPQYVFIAWCLSKQEIRLHGGGPYLCTFTLSGALGIPWFVCFNFVICQD